MKYFQICPQVAGVCGDETVCDDWSSRPVVIRKLQFELESWPEDDLILATVGGYAGTSRLAEAIKKAELTGIEFDRLEMIKGDQFWLQEEEHANEKIPEYRWFKFTGEPGVDDFGIIGKPVALPLTVSERALKILRQFNMNNLRTKGFRVK
ncbi:MAG: hypothetical protein IPK73_23380 [Candidatus Obscuribacter sp.]|nr:hypothetical protein [Candidatus Obscuribacter sp.]MBK9277056.1 hypothetical protein [Candidatus Obscuribacter sp.]